MAKVIDKLWNWGHLEGSHNKCTGLDCKMSPEEFANEYGIKNAFIVSYGGNITPPFDDMAKRFSCLNEIKWSVLGDASTPLPSSELGNTDDILDILDIGKNITGGVVDDFFSEKRMKRFTPEVLKKIKKKLNDNGLDFWCVLYASQLDMDLDAYIDCFDGVSFWIWKSEDIENMEEYIEKLFKISNGKPVMTGIYLWDYSENARPMNVVIFEKQLSFYMDLLKAKKTEGIVFCSGTIGDVALQTNTVLKKYIIEHGNDEID